jgi:hypothetical protein
MCVVLALGNVMCHMPVEWSRLPVSMALLASSTLYVLPSSKMLHPASHSWPSDSREQLSRAGTMWALRAAGRSIGRSISVTWVDSIVAPLGILILMGFRVRHLLSTGHERLT